MSRLPHLNKNEFPILTIAFLIGGMIGFLIHSFAMVYQRLVVSEIVSFQIDPSNIVSLIVTVLLAVYVLRRIGKSDDSEKAEKLILVDYLSDFRKEYEAVLRGYAQKQDVGFTEVVSRLKRFRIKLAMLLRLASSRGYISQSSTNVMELTASLTELWVVLTDTPVRGSLGTGSVSVQSGRIVFSQDVVDRISDQVYLFQEALFKVIVEINAA
jgi:hypothetical protein